MINRSRFTLSALVLAMLMLAAYTNAQLVNNQHSDKATDITLTAAHADIGKVKAKGAFTADFGLPGSLPLNEVAPLIERDRMYMAARPGCRTSTCRLELIRLRETF